MKKYLSFFLQYVHDYLTNRLRLFIVVISTFIAPLVIMVVLNNLPGTEVNGMSKEHIVSYYLLTSILFVFLNSNIDYYVKEAIQDGELATYLIKPVHFWLVALVKDLSWRIVRLVFGLPIFLLLIFLYRDSFTGLILLNAELYILMVVISYFLVFSYSYAVGLLAFWLEEVWGIQNVKEVSLILLSGAALPYTFFPEVLQQILIYTPFPYFINWPLRTGFSGNVIIEFLIALSWLGIFSILNYYMWKKGIKRYSAFGTY